MDEEFQIQRAQPAAPAESDEEFSIQRGGPSAAAAPKGKPEPPAYRAFTPKRLGDFLEQRTLPQIEENKERAALQAEQDRARNEATLPGVGPAGQKFIAGVGNAGSGVSLGIMPWMSAAIGKGAGKLGIPGYEQFAEPSIPEIKHAIDIKQQAANELQPGAALMGSLVGIGAGAKMLPTIAPTRGPAVSGALTGAAYGAVSGAANEGDLVDAIKGAGVGLVGGAIAAPLMERAASGITRLFVGGKSVVDAAGNLTPEAVKVAAKAGLSQDEIQRLGPQLQQVFEQRGLTPAAAREARFREVGIEPKRGMVESNPRQLAAENEFGNYGPQAAQATKAAENFVGGQQPPLRDAIFSAVNKAESNAKGLKSSVDAAYAKAGDTPGSFSRETLENVGEKILQSWTSDPRLLAFRNNEVAAAAAAKLNKDLGTFLEAGNGVRIMHRNFRAVEEARKGLNESFAAAKTQTDRAAIRKMIESYDDYIESAINSGAFKGDPNVLKDWQAARKLFSDYQNKFGVRKSGEEAGSLLKAIVEGNKSPEDVAKMMFSFAGSGDAAMKQNALKTYFQLRRALGPNSPELDNIRRAYVQEIMTPVAVKGARGEEVIGPKSFANAAKRIEQFLKGNASDFSRRVLTQEERDALGRYAEVMKRASATTPEETHRKVNQLTNAIATALPVIASGASYLLQLTHPLVAAGVGMVAAGTGAVRGYRGSEFVSRRAAQAPLRNEARPYRYPGTRPVVPLSINAAPEVGTALPPLEESQRVNPEDPRAARATGGKVSLNHHREAEALIKLAENAKKHQNSHTEQLLGLDDSAVAKALKVANDHI